MLDSPLGQPSAVADDFSLTPAQVAYWEAFGFLLLPGLFRAEIDAIGRAFDQTFAETPSSASVDDLDPSNATAAFATSGRVDAYHHLNRGQHRAIIPDIVERADGLRWIATDARISGVTETLLGPDPVYYGSDGNVLDCDTSWHCDVYGAPIADYHVKLLFYLDPLDHDHGALRVIPGTHHYQSAFAQKLRHDLDDWTKIPEILGLECDQVPAWTVPTQPGDVVAINFRTLHATFHGNDHRRLFTMSYRSTTSSGPGSQA